MLARVAEALYLTGRNIERAETIARLLESTHSTGLEAALGDNDLRYWGPLLETAGDREVFELGHGAPDQSSVGWFLTFSPDNPDSIEGCIRRAREEAHSVRDRLPVAVWEGLNETYLELESWSPGRLNREGMYPFSRALRRRAAMMHGQIATGMRRDDAWYFMRLGRFLERAWASARWLRVSVTSMAESQDGEVDAALATQLWGGVLEAAGATEAYATRHTGVPSPETVLRFLLFDERFPRSLTFCFKEVDMCLVGLIDDLAMGRRGRALELVQEGAAELARADGRNLSDSGDFLAELEQTAWDVGRAIHTDCFAATHLARDVPDAQIQSQSQN